MTDRLSLYGYHACPYCRFVFREIERLGLEIELRDTLRDENYRQELRAARGRGTVPVLRIEDAQGQVTWLPESRDIVAYLRAKHG